MSDAFTDIFADAVVPALQGLHGRTVKHFPKGYSGSGKTVSGCLWTPDEDPERDASRDGERYVWGGSLEVPEEVCVSEEDEWVIDGERYKTPHVGALHAGMHKLTLRNVKAVSVSRRRQRL